MQNLLLGLIVLAVTLTVLFWFGSQSLQSFLYTSASEWLFWQAPVAAMVIVLFLAIWWLINLAFATSGTHEIPFGVPWEFSARIDVISRPVPEFESKRRTSEPAIYVVDKSAPYEIRYRKRDSEEFWNAIGVEYVKFTHDSQEYNFVPDKTRSYEEGYIVFVDANSGLEMNEFEIGRLGYTSFVRLAIFFLLNAMHLALWVVCFWLILRFHFWHAVALGAAMWFLFTLAVVPTLFASAIAG